MHHRGFYPKPLAPFACLSCCCRCGQETSSWFADVYGYDVVPSMVFVGAASDQGMNVVNAFGNCGVEVVLCNAHRLNTAVHWALGIAGSDATNMNPEMKALVGKIAALVGHFSHSSANNDAFRAVQEALIATDDVDELDALNLVRRNDTRWGGTHAMFRRLLRVERALKM